MKINRLKLMAALFTITFPISVTIAILYTHRSLYAEVWEDILSVFKGEHDDI